MKMRISTSVKGREEVNPGRAEEVGGQTVRNGVNQTNFGHRMKDHESSEKI